MQKPVAARASYHHGNLRRALLEGALSLFEQRGSLDFTLRELARAVGVTHNAPYRHFATKAELVDALSEEAALRLGALAAKALERAGDDPRARVVALGEAYVSFALAEPLRFRLVLSRPVRSGRDRADPLRVLEATLEEARARGVARVDRSARELAVAAWSLVHGYASLLSSERLPRREAHVRRYGRVLGDLFWDGAGAPSGRGARPSARS
jgi:AcrR family transcriptional regulator